MNFYTSKSIFFAILIYSSIWLSDKFKINKIQSAPIILLSNLIFRDYKIFSQYRNICNFFTFIRSLEPKIYYQLIRYTTAQLIHIFLQSVLYKVF